MPGRYFFLLTYHLLTYFLPLTTRKLSTPVYLLYSSPLAACCSTACGNSLLVTTGLLRAAAYLQGTGRRERVCEHLTGTAVDRLQRHAAGRYLWRVSAQ